MEQTVITQPDTLALIMTDWRFWAFAIPSVVTAAIAYGETRVKLGRLLDLHKPEKMVEEAEDRGKVRADFRTAQQDITRLEDRVEKLEGKLRTDVKDLHKKIERGGVGDD